MKAAIKKTLQEMGLLGIVETVYPAYSLLLTLKNNFGRNREFRRENADFPLPPTLIAFDAHGEVDWRNYYDYGLRNATIVSSLITESLGDRAEAGIFEWGCGPARVIRHLPQLLGRPGFTYAGSDYNKKSIDWCNRHIDGITFIRNELAPPLPVAAESHDFIYCISVFTHLSEKNHHDWLKELFRVLKPGGFLMFTTHGDSFSYHLQGEDLRDYQDGKLVVWNRSREGKRDFTAFHSPRYVRERMLADHAVTRFIESGALGQDIWVVRKCSHHPE